MTPQLRQNKGKIWLGRLKVTFSRIGAYIGYINFLMLFLTFYSIKGYEYASLGIFLVLAGVGIVILGAFDYFVMLPSEQAFLNEQAAKHQNPIYNEIKEIKNKLSKMESKQKGSD